MLLLGALALLLAQHALYLQSSDAALVDRQDTRTLSLSPHGASLPNSLRRFIRWAPKAELHVHVEGTLEPEMMLKFAERNGLPKPYPSVEAARAAYHFSDLQDFLDLYYAGCAVLRTQEDFYELAMAYFRRAAADRVAHAEVTFDPQTHLANGLGFDTFMRGLAEAANDAEEQLDMSVSYIMAFRKDLPLQSAHAALTASLPWRHRIAAVGLDSTELGVALERFAELYDRAAALGFERTAHAGEEGGPENVWQALQLLHVSRVDHGVHCLDDPALVTHLNTTRTTLTVCPLSNLKLQVYKGQLAERLGQLVRSGLAVTVNSDDPAYFGGGGGGGYIVANLEWLAAAAKLDVHTVAALVANGFKGAFAARMRGGETRRRALVEAVWRLAEEAVAEEEAEAAAEAAEAPDISSASSLSSSSAGGGGWVRRSLRGRLA